MAHVRSTAHPFDAAIGAGSKGHESGNSTERMESALLSNVASHSGVRGEMDEGSRTRSYYFGPLTVTVTCIRGMVDNGYFDMGTDREPEEETMPEP
jgi:hypothetical protein